MRMPPSVFSHSESVFLIFVGVGVASLSILKTGFSENVSLRVFSMLSEPIPRGVMFHEVQRIHFTYVS